MRAPPLGAILSRGAQAFISCVVDKRAGRTLVEVVIVALLFEVAVKRIWVCVRPVGQQHHVVAIVGDGFFAPRLNDESAEQANLLLTTVVTVIPIRPVLDYRNSIEKCFARCDACKTQPGHAIHLRRNTNTVPVNRGRLWEMICHGDRHCVSLAPLQCRTRQRSIYLDRLPASPCKVSLVSLDC